MKKFVLALAAAAALAAAPSFALAAPAAGQETTAAVKAMLDAMEVRKAMAAMSAQMQRGLPDMMRQQVGAAIQADTSMSAEKKKEAMAKLEQRLPSMTQAISGILNDPAVTEEMIAAMVPLYASAYTVAEIKELTAFYRSPLGRKMMEVTPRLSAEGMALGQRIMLPRIGKLMQAAMQDTQKP